MLENHAADPGRPHLFSLRRISRTGVQCENVLGQGLNKREELCIGC